MKQILMGLSLGVLCCSLAVAQTKGRTGMSAQEFVEFAAQNDMTEAHLGQLAAQNAASDDVKQTAQMLVNDHTADYSRLSMVASKAGLTVPKGLDAKHQKMVAPFEKLQGKAFDRRYAKELLTGHEAAIAAYEKESREGESAELKEYATQALPTLNNHRKAIQGLSGAK
jgi:putative membrane protein